MFIDSVDEANTSTEVYSMVEIAKAHKLNIYVYLNCLLEHQPTEKMTDAQLAGLHLGVKTAIDQYNELLQLASGKMIYLIALLFGDTSITPTILYHRFNDIPVNLCYDSFRTKKTGQKARKGKAMMNRNIALSHLHEESYLSLEYSYEGLVSMRSCRDNRWECDEIIMT